MSVWIKQEIAVWSNISQYEIKQHVVQVKGYPVLDEFAVAFQYRKTCPLHFEVFRRCAPHKPHEGNVEGWFSTVKGLSQPSSNPSWTAKLARVAINNRVQVAKPRALWVDYQKKYGKKDPDASTNCSF